MSAVAKKPEATPQGKKRRINRAVSIRFKILPDQKTVNKVQRGVETGLGITQFVSTLLEANEQLPLSRKLTDETIKQQLIKEFPNAKNVKKLKSGAITVGYYRTLYNLGHFSVGGKKPKQKSHRWTADGQIANLKTGKPLGETNGHGAKVKNRVMRKKRIK